MTSSFFSLASGNLRIADPVKEFYTEKYISCSSFRTNSGNGCSNNWYFYQSDGRSVYGSMNLKNSNGVDDTWSLEIQQDRRPQYENIPTMIIYNAIYGEAVTTGEIYLTILKEKL